VQLLGTPIGGATVPVRVRFHNIGSKVWTRSSVELLNLSAGWRPQFLALPAASQTANGRTLDMTVSLNVPRQRGNHVLLFQLSRPNVGVFGAVAILGIVVDDLVTPAARWQSYR